MVILAYNLRMNLILNRHSKELRRSSKIKTAVAGPLLESKNLSQDID